MAMHICQIGLTDNIPLALESKHPRLRLDKGEYLEAVNLSTPIVSIPTDIAIMSL